MIISEFRIILCNYCLIECRRIERVYCKESIETVKNNAEKGMAVAEPEPPTVARALVRRDIGIKSRSPTARRQVGLHGESGINDLIPESRHEYGFES